MGSSSLHVVVILATFAVSTASHYGYEYYYTFATCDLVPGVDSGIKGSITMRQKIPTRKVYGIFKQYYPLEIYVDANITNTGTGIKEHGIHVHAFGDLTDSCQGAGGHYNPLKTNHGGPSDPFDMRHIGDWGNIKEVNGQIRTRFLDYLAPLYGPYSIYGRGIVLHEGVDDLGRGGDKGSLATGNAGRRLGCCIIRNVDKVDF